MQSIGSLMVLLILQYVIMCDSITDGNPVDQPPCVQLLACRGTTPRPYDDDAIKLRRNGNGDIASGDSVAACVIMIGSDTSMDGNVAANLFIAISRSIVNSSDGSDDDSCVIICRR